MSEERQISASATKDPVGCCQKDLLRSDVGVPNYLAKMSGLSPLSYFESPENIRLDVLLYIHFPLSFRNVEDGLHERGIEICHKTVRFWWNKFGSMLAAQPLVNSL